MKNKIIRTFTVTLAAVLCMTAFSVTAFAGGADPDPLPLPEETETPATGGMELVTEDDADNEDKDTTGEAKVGYEIPMTRYFYEYQAPEAVEDIVARITALEQDISAGLAELFHKEG